VRPTASDERQVAEGRWLPAEGLVEQQLPGGACEQVVAADHLLNRHRMVIRGHGQFVGGQVLPPPDDKVTEVDPRGSLDPAGGGVVEGDDSSIGHPEPPGHTAGIRGPLPGFGPQGRREDRLPLGVGREAGLQQVLAGVGAGVDRPGRLEPPPDVAVPLPAAALEVGAVGTPEIRPLGPCQAEPAEVVEGSRGELVAAAVGVEVFDPQHEPGRSGPAGGLGEGAGMAHVQEARGRGGQATSAGDGRVGAHHSHQLPVNSTNTPRPRLVAAWVRIASIGRRVAAATPVTIANQPAAAIASAGWVSTA